MATETFSSPSSNAYTYTVSGDKLITIKIYGAGGGSSLYDGNTYKGGGVGGYTEIEYSASDGETIDIYVGEQGEDGQSDGQVAEGGVGHYNGGDGAWYDGNPSSYGGAGGGSSAVLDESGSLIGSADSGGGGTAYNGFARGGGGARGGDSHSEDSIDTVKPTDGAGSGYGGDSGDSNSNYAGYDGGYEVIQGSELSGSVGGGNSGDGKVILEIPEIPSPPLNLSTSVTDDDIDLSWTDNSSNEDGFYIYRAKYSGSSKSDYTQIDSVGSNTTTYTDSALLDGEKYYYRVSAYSSSGESDLSNEASAITDLPAPSSVSASTISNAQIDVSWDNVINNGEYHVQISRDGASYIDPSGGATTLGSNNTTASYGPSSDNSYDSQVGIDSSFQFRVRSETEHTSSSWVSSGTVYTDPIPPHNPSVSRSDGNSISISWSNQSNVESGIEIQYREDAGSGYGSWTTVTTTSTGGESYSTSSLPDDVRRQYRLRTVAPDSDTGKWSYADYGNQNNVYFEDDFESNDLSAWDSVEQDAFTTSGNAPDSGFTSADQGTYYVQLDASGRIEKNLGDLSDESDVIVKCAMAAGSMDSATEYADLEWYDGSSWQNLRTLGAEYNKQGWVEVTALVDSAWLSTDNRIAFDQEGGEGDYTYVDRVVVSDILHEYTQPAAPSGLSLDTSVEDEITASWTGNSAFTPSGLTNGYNVWHKKTSDSSYTYDTVYSESTTITGLPDGEAYDVQVRASVNQFRHGSSTGTFLSNWDTGIGTTLLPSPSSITITDVHDTSIDVTWTDQSDNEDGFRVYYRQDGGTWTQFSDLSAGTTSETVTELSSETRYELYVESYTEHTSSASATTDAVSTLFTRSVTFDTTTDISASRIASYNRSQTFETATDIQASRSGLDKSRSITFDTTTDVTATRSVSKSRTTTLQGDGQHTSIQALLEVFPDEQALDVQWDFDADQMAFVTEWLDEDSHIPDTARDGIGVYLNGDLSTTIDVWVQYDIDNDGVAEITAEPLSMPRTDKTLAFDDPSLLGEDGQYRVVVQGLRHNDTINQVDIGPVHRNL